MTDLNLVCFLSLARHKDIFITAQELAMREQRVMCNIDQMEQELSVKLFRRKPGKVSLTAAGEYYYELIRTYEEKLCAELMNMNHPKGNEVLHIAWCEWTGCPNWIKRIIYEFSQIHQTTDIRLICDSAENICALFAKHNVDVVISSRALSRKLYPPHKTVLLGEQPVYLAIEKSHILMNEPMATSVFAPFLHMTVPMGEEDREGAVKRVNEFHARLGYLPRQIEVSHNWSSVYLNVSMGNGMCLSPCNEILEKNERIKLIPTGENVTLTANYLEKTACRCAEEFVKILMEERDKAYE